MASENRQIGQEAKYQIDGVMPRRLVAGRRTWQTQAIAQNRLGDLTKDGGLAGAVKHRGRPARRWSLKCRRFAGKLQPPGVFELAQKLAGCLQVFGGLMLIRMRHTNV